MGTTRRWLCYGLLLLIAIYGTLFAAALAERNGNFYPESRTPIAPDFDVFFAAAQVVASGDGDQIYDPVRQETEQARVLGGVPEFSIHFFHPAWMVTPYIALTRLPY